MILPTLLHRPRFLTPLLVGLFAACATTSRTSARPLSVQFEEPARTIGAPGSGDPRVFVRASGAISVLVTRDQGDGADLELLRSRDGDHYQAPLRLNAEPGEVSSHAEGSPQLLAGPGMRLCALWLARPKSGEAGLRLSCSRNGGEQFAAPVTVGTGTAPSFFAGTVTAAGTLVITWFAYAETGQPGTAQLWMTSSRDGKAFEPPSQIAADVCPCCRPALAAEGKLLLAAWRHVEKGEMRDIVLARSEDDGRHWSAPAPVSADGWKINGCPHSGPAVLIADGRVNVAWLTGAGDRQRLFWTHSEDGGRTFAPRQPLGAGLLDGNHPSLGVIGRRVFAAFEARDPAEAKGWGPRHVYLQELGSPLLYRAPSTRAATYATVVSLSPEALVFAWTEPRDDSARAALLSRVRIQEQDGAR